MGGFSLYSEKLNQRVADIELRRFLDFSGKYNLVIDSLKLQGEFIIGNDRSVYTRKMYDTWKEKYNKRVETIINKKDLIRGHRYETPCGSHFIYLGRYKTINIKDKLDNNSKMQMTSIKSIHLICDARGFNIQPLKQKVRKDEGFAEIWTPEKIDKKCEEYRNKSNVAYLGQENLKNPTLQLKEIPKPSYSYGYRRYFQFAEINYDNKNIIITSEFKKSYEIASYLYNYDKQFEQEVERYKNSIKNGYKPQYPKQRLSGELVCLTYATVYDEINKTFNYDAFKYGNFRYIRGDKNAYTEILRYFTLEAVEKVDESKTDKDVQNA